MLLTVKAHSTVNTLCDNPFNYVLEPWAVCLPLDYPRSLFTSLTSYLGPPEQMLNVGDGSIAELALDLARQVDYNTVSFLGHLNQTIYERCEYELRPTGVPHPPHQTWRHKRGSCRDFVVLFMAACRAVGLAARFVSGYEKGDPDLEKHLHAWAEVYLPGAGWRGYDPTLGLVVCDRHIALCANVWPEYTTPVLGTHRPSTEVALHNQIDIVQLD